MKICNDEVTEKKGPELIRGNLYQHGDGEIYICAYEDMLISLKDGNGWWGNDGFGLEGHRFADVTDQYCLKKISE